jgi:hypothetical protein
MRYVHCTSSLLHSIEQTLYTLGVWGILYLQSIMNIPDFRSLKVHRAPSIHYTLYSLRYPVRSLY